jgi:hypothetical protein
MGINNGSRFSTVDPFDTSYGAFFTLRGMFVVPLPLWSERINLSVAFCQI